MIDRWTVLLVLLSSPLAIACGDDDGTGDGGASTSGDEGPSTGPGTPTDDGAETSDGATTGGTDGGSTDTDAADSGTADVLYMVSTCSFVGAKGDCDPIALPGGPSSFFEVSFSLINPATAPGCAGDVQLSVNGPTSGPGMMVWDAHELDAATCMEVGEPLMGNRVLGGTVVEDVYLPSGDFTFRMVVDEV